MLVTLLSLTVHAAAPPVVVDADTPARPQDALFEAPVELLPGGQRVERLYPSPALFDIDGDGTRDLIVGDLFGKLTASTRDPGNDTMWTSPTPLQSEGKPLKLNNW